MIETGSAAPAVTVRSLADIRIVAATGCRFVLISSPGAAVHAGCLAWIALAEEARAVAGPLVAGDILDCADAPGRALEALRLGQKTLVLDRDVVSFEDLRRRALGLGATLLGARPPAFDMDDHGRRGFDLAAWLRPAEGADPLASRPPP